MQARLERFSSNVTGTVISAIVVKQGNVQSIQIEADNGLLNLYIAGVKHELVVSDSPLVVSSSGIVSDDLSGGIGGVGDPTTMAMMADQLFVRMDDTDGLVVSTADGASVSVSLQSGFLSITTEMPEKFRDMTSGLLGRFNGDPKDDFRDRSGAVLDLTTEQEIYEQFGLVCKLCTYNAFNSDRYSRIPAAACLD